MDKAIRFFWLGWKHSTKFKLYISALFGFILYQTWKLISQDMIPNSEVVEYIIYTPILFVVGIYMIAELVTHDPIVMDKIKKEGSI